MAMLAFALSLFIGGIQTDNPFTTTVSRALVAMVGTFVIGLIVGSMGQKMIDENMKTAKEKLSDLEVKEPSIDR